MRLRFTPRAIEDLAAISDYLKGRSPSAALNVRAAIYASLELLLLFPSIGRRQKTEGVRKLVTSRFGYLVYYSIDTAHDEIIILAVRHPAREREHEDD